MPAPAMTHTHFAARRLRAASPTCEIRNRRLPNDVTIQGENVLPLSTGAVAISLDSVSKAWTPWFQTFSWCIVCDLHFLSLAFGFN